METLINKFEGLGYIVTSITSGECESIYLSNDINNINLAVYYVKYKDVKKISFKPIIEGNIKNNQNFLIVLDITGEVDVSIEIAMNLHEKYKNVLIFDNNDEVEFLQKDLWNFVITLS